MSSTTYTDIPEVDPNQIGKAAAVNTAIGAVDRMLGEVRTLDLTGLVSPIDITYQATGDEPVSNKTALRFAFLRVIGTVSDDFTVRMPTGKRRMFAVRNLLSSDFNVFVSVAGGEGVFIEPDATQWLFSSGVNVVPVAPPVFASEGDDDW